MTIVVPKIVRFLNLGVYASELQGQQIPVWVNPPRKLVTKFVEMQELILGYQKKLEEIVERSQKDGKGEDLTKDVAELDAKILAVNDELYAWFSEIWGQGEEPNPIEDVKEFALTNADTDPGLWAFCTQTTVFMIKEHRAGKRKN